LTFDFPALKEKVLCNQIGRGVHSTRVEEAFIPYKYGMEMTSHLGPISFGKLVLAFIFFLIFLVSFFDHFQILVFFGSIYIILLLDLFIYFSFLHFEF